MDKKKDPKMILMLEAARDAEKSGDDEDEDEGEMCTCPECGHEFKPE